MPDEETVERRLLLSVDARRYGSAPGRRHREIQAALLKVLDEAAGRSGLRRPTWDVQQAGDGQLAVLPLSEPESRVVQAFPRELHDALRRHNRDLKDEARLRLRLAVHFGPASPGLNGYADTGPVTVSRLCDSEPLKRALEASGADLAVIFSRPIYEDTIKQEYTLLDLAGLLKVRVSNKELDEDAWIWIPGHDVPAPSDDPAGPAEPSRQTGFAMPPPPLRDIFDGAVIPAAGEPPPDREGSRPPGLG